MNPTVSVLVPTYNRARYIEECINSILAQTYPPSQIIVIDDGSTDETPAVLAQYADRIIYLRKENGGKAAALNHGLPMAIGDYIWIFDDDDVALPDSIERRLRPLINSPNVGFVYSSHFIGIDGADSKIVIDRSYELPVVREEQLFLALLEGCFFTQQGVLARRSCYQQLERFDESFLRGQDYEMLIRMARRFRGVGLPEPTFVFRRHNGIRGPSKSQHNSADRDNIWMGFEHRIGRKIREDLPLEVYMAEADLKNPDERDRLRQAYLQRMAIMAGKGLADEFSADLIDAVTVNMGQRLDDRARTVIRRAIAREFMQVALRVEPERFLGKICTLRSNIAGRDALRALARGIFRLIRHNEPDRLDRGRATRLWARLLWYSIRIT